MLISSKCFVKHKERSQLVGRSQKPGLDPVPAAMCFAEPKPLGYLNTGSLLPGKEPP